MHHPQTIARVFGVLYLVTFITSIPAFFFYGPVLNDPRYVLGGGGGDTSVAFGALLELLLIVANIGTAVVPYPIFRRWLNDSKRDNLAPRTFANYRSHIRGHLVPFLGHVKLKSLTSANIQAFYRTKRDTGLSPATIRYIHAILSGSLKQAVRWRLLPYNAAEAVELPKQIRHEGKAFSVEEAKRFLEAAREERLEALYVLAVTCGLRQGELLGLKWEDMDLESGTIWVRRQLQRMRDGSGLAFLPLKNPDGRREVALGPMAVEALRKHRARQAEEKLILGALYEDMRLIFATPKGTPLEASNLVNRSFKPLLQRAEVPKIRFHELRHTCGTIMGTTGVDPKHAQDRLGHANVSVTLNTYTHVLPEARAEVARKIEGALGP